MMHEDTTQQHPEQGPDEGFLSWQFDCHVNHLKDEVITHNGVVGPPHALPSLNGYVGIYADVRYSFNVHTLRKNAAGEAVTHAEYFPRALLRKLEEWRHEYAAGKEQEQQEAEARQRQEQAA